MSAVILLPDVPAGMTKANIYVDDVLEDTITATNIEWESESIAVASVIKVSFTDDITETTLAIVQTFEQRLIAHIRNIENISESDLSDERINGFIDVAKIELKTDICMYKYGVDVALISDAYYKLPNNYYYDENFGGAISYLDFELYTVEVPTYDYSPQVTVIPIAVNDKTKYVELDTAIPTTEKLRINYYYTGRNLDAKNGFLLLGAKIAALQAADAYTNASIGDSVKIGDITVKGGAASSSQLKNTWVQKNARYKKFVANFKIGFYKVR